MAPSIEHQSLMSQSETHLVQNVFFAKQVWSLMKPPLSGINLPSLLLENVCICNEGMAINEKGHCVF